MYTAQNNSTMFNDAIKWRNSYDTGLSSVALVSYLMGWPGHFRDDRATPADASDFGRCLRAINTISGLKEKLPLAKNISKSWAAIVDNWDELESLYFEDLSYQASFHAYKTFSSIIQEIDKDRLSHYMQTTKVLSPTWNSFMTSWQELRNLHEDELYTYKASKCYTKLKQILDVLCYSCGNANMIWQTDSRSQCPLCKAIRSGVSNPYLTIH